MVERSETAVPWTVQLYDSDLSMKELADAINVPFLEPLEEYRLQQALSHLPLDDELVEFPDVS